MKLDSEHIQTIETQSQNAATPPPENSATANGARVPNGNLARAGSAQGVRLTRCCAYTVGAIGLTVTATKIQGSGGPLLSLALIMAAGALVGWGTYSTGMDIFWGEDGLLTAAQQSGPDQPRG